MFAPATLTRYRDRFRELVARAGRAPRSQDAQAETYRRAFDQVMNLWQADPLAREFTFGKRLAGIAAQLMGAAGVRLYHDQALHKRPSPDPATRGHTPWHCDRYYWPLDAAGTCTAWVPFQAVAIDSGPMSFAAGSHLVDLGREHAIGDAGQAEIGARLAAAGLVEKIEAYALGEVSFHDGWTFHRAEPIRSGQAREVMTVIYMDAQARVAEPANANQRADRAAWLPGVAVGELAASPLNPLLWP